jgi:hypothetical protein
VTVYDHGSPRQVPKVPTISPLTVEEAASTITSAITSGHRHVYNPFLLKVGFRWMPSVLKVYLWFGAGRLRKATLPTSSVQALPLT